MTLVFLCLEFVGHKAFQRRWQFIEDQLPSSLGNAKSFCVSLLVYSMRICIYIYILCAISQCWDLPPNLKVHYHYLCLWITSNPKILENHLKAVESNLWGSPKLVQVSQISISMSQWRPQNFWNMLNWFLLDSTLYRSAWGFNRSFGPLANCMLLMFCYFKGHALQTGRNCFALRRGYVD